jgi:hypothetical protein
MLQAAQRALSYAGVHVSEAEVVPAEVRNELVIPGLLLWFLCYHWFVFRRAAALTRHRCGQQG